MKAAYGDDIRQAVLERHDLGTAPASAVEFMPFYNARRERIRARLTTLLSRVTAESAEKPSPTLSPA
jgi:hypothetical protein